MKKLISVLIGVTFALGLFLNVKINAEQKDESDLQLKNLEALACYEIESGNPGSWTCCAPWSNYCYMVPGGQMLPGTTTLHL